MQRVELVPSWQVGYKTWKPFVFLDGATGPLSWPGSYERLLEISFDGISYEFETNTRIRLEFFHLKDYLREVP